MPSRRAHRKSRNGCQGCKERRIKCDEKWPTCSNCLSRGQECTLSRLPTGTVESSRSMQTYLPAPPSNSSCLLPVGLYAYSPHSTARAGLQQSDLQLMHHWSTVTSLGFLQRPMFRNIWQIDIPKEAISHDFLMHGLLAFSALHVARLDPSNHQRFEMLGLVHEQLALKAFSPLLHNITPDNCHALFAFGALLGMLRIALPQKLLFGSEVDRLVEFLDLMRGAVTNIVETAYVWFPPRGLGLLLSVSDPILELAQTPETSPMADFIAGVLASIKSLRNRNKLISIDEHVQALYAESIDQLEIAFQRTVMSSSDRNLVFLWGVIVKARYIDLLRVKRPMALIILAHYGVILHTINDQWWGEAWGSQLVVAIHELLDEGWRATIQWPMEMVQRDPTSIKVGREWL